MLINIFCANSLTAFHCTTFPANITALACFMTAQTTSFSTTEMDSYDRFWYRTGRRTYLVFQVKAARDASVYITMTIGNIDIEGGAYEFM